MIEVRVRVLIKISEIITSQFICKAAMINHHYLRVSLLNIIKAVMKNTA